VVEPHATADINTAYQIGMGRLRCTREHLLECLPIDNAHLAIHDLAFHITTGGKHNPDISL
jgi:hypothetical protein